MKLPKELCKEVFIPTGYCDDGIVEAIVRDCAERCIKGCTKGSIQMVFGQQRKELILARYGLEPKP